MLLVGWVNPVEELLGLLAPNNPCLRVFARGYDAEFGKCDTNA